MSSSAARGENAAVLAAFFVGRAFVSTSFALALQNLPDATKAMGSKAQLVITRMDFFNAVSAFLSRPLWGSLIDSSFGRQRSMALGCALSAAARWFYAMDTSSTFRYSVFRFLNNLSLIPVMQASTAYLADACGGRSTEMFTKWNRRMWMFLAVVRILVTSQSAATASAAVKRTPSEEEQATSIAVATQQLQRAAMASLCASLIFLVFCRENAGAFKPQVIKNPITTYRNSFRFFFETPERFLLLPCIVLSCLPNYMGTVSTRFYQEKFKWGQKERAMLTNMDNLAEVLCPLLLNEMTSLSPQSYVWAARASALAYLNTGMTSNSMSVLLNPILTRVAVGGPEWNRLLQVARKTGAATGEGTLEAALSSLEFPIALTAPWTFFWLTEMVGSRTPFFLVASLTLLNSEFFFPRAKLGLGGGKK